MLANKHTIDNLNPGNWGLSVVRPPNAKGSYHETIIICTVQKKKKKPSHSPLPLN